jgi:hypothetical protein
MHVLIRLFFLSTFLFLLGCANGGPLTPSDAFMVIKDAAEKNDRGVIMQHLSAESLDKIDEFIKLTVKLSDTQLKAIAHSENIPVDKIRNMNPADCTALYFARNRYGNSLADIFNDEIIAVDVNGSSAVVKTSGGFDLDFVREGPYWKFNLSKL